MDDSSGNYDKEEKCMRSYIDIIHLSDLHFGQHHRYIGDTPYDTSLSKILEDLDGLSDKYKINPSLVVVTGDLAETGAPGEYLKAREFLSGLPGNLSLGASRTVIVPGNHDVNYDMYMSSKFRHIAHGKSFELPYFEKFEIFKEFYDDFYEGDYTLSEILYNIFPYPELGLIVAGLNSCVKETTEKHLGWIGLEQVHRAGKEIDELDPERKHLRIAAFHHNFFRESRLDNENLADADEIRGALAQHRFSILMHGHRHINAIQQTYVPPSIPLTVICTGSAGLDHSVLPDHPNQYQILRISPRSAILLMRQYSSQSIGGAGYGKWIVDTSMHDSGKVGLSLNFNLEPVE